MRSSFFRLLLVIPITAITCTYASAQGSFFTSLSGTVVDSQGAVIPGANVKIKNLSLIHI